VQITQICTIIGLSKRDSMAVQSGGSSRHTTVELVTVGNKAPVPGQACIGPASPETLMCPAVSPGYVRLA
jgi:hypothetical protein